MINGFDKETAPLSDSEMELLDDFIGILKEAKGKKRAINSIRIADIITARQDVEIEGSRVRKIINHIRQNDLVPCLLSNSAGYFVAETEEEVRDYMESLRGRELAIRAVRDSIERQMNMRFYGGAQGRLF